MIIQKILKDFTGTDSYVLIVMLRLVSHTFFLLQDTYTLHYLHNGMKQPQLTLHYITLHYIAVHYITLHYKAYTRALVIV